MLHSMNKMMCTACRLSMRTHRHHITTLIKIYSVFIFIIDVFFLFCLFFLQDFSDNTLTQLKSCFMEAYDENQDGKIEIREVCIVYILYSISLSLCHQSRNPQNTINFNHKSCLCFSYTQAYAILYSLLIPWCSCTPREKSITAPLCN